MSDELKPTNSGLNLIKEWARLKEHMQRCETDLEVAKSNVKIAGQKLGEWLVPKDASVGEKFSLAVHDGFLHVEIGEERSQSNSGGLFRTYKYTWRNYPREGL